MHRPASAAAAAAATALLWANPVAAAAAARAPPAALTASPAVLRTDGEAVVVSWATAGFTPAPGDFVAVSCGPTLGAGDFLEDSLGGALPVDANATAAGAVRTFPLANMRCNYTLRYVRPINSASAGQADADVPPPLEMATIATTTSSSSVYMRGRADAADTAGGGGGGVQAFYGDNNLTVLAEVVVPLAAGLADSPAQCHLAFADAPDAMWALWTSASGTEPTVQFGTGSPANLSRTATGTSGTYLATDMCHAPANTTGQQNWIDPGQLHAVLLEGLAPDTTHYYRVGNDAHGWSEVRAFQSRPALGARREVRFLAYGDQDWDEPPPASSTTASNCLRDALESGYSDFVLHFGDLSYGMGTGTDWEMWLRQNQALAARVPYMVSVGNHEFDYITGGDHDPSRTGAGANSSSYRPDWGNFGSDSHGECGVPVVRRFKSPTNGNGIFWYSFDFGLVHAVQLSSEHDLSPGSAQYAWLEADLAKANRTTTPWVVVTLHRMLYTTQLCEEGDYHTSLGLRARLEPLLRRYGVNLVLAGHQHSYERSCEVFNGTCVNDSNNGGGGGGGDGGGAAGDSGAAAARGTVHITAGTAGAGLEHCGFDPAQYGNYSVARVNAWGYLRVAADEDRMVVGFVENLSGSVWDQVTLLPWTGTGPTAPHHAGLLPEQQGGQADAPSRGGRPLRGTSTPRGA